MEGIDSQYQLKNEFEVEAIVDCNQEAGIYRVRWKGYEAEDDTWEPPGNLEGCQDLVDTYHELTGTQRPGFRKGKRPASQTSEEGRTDKRRKNAPPTLQIQSYYTRLPSKSLSGSISRRSAPTSPPQDARTNTKKGSIGAHQQLLTSLSVSNRRPQTPKKSRQQVEEYQAQWRSLIDDNGMNLRIASNVDEPPPENLTWVDRLVYNEETGISIETLSDFMYGCGCGDEGCDGDCPCLGGDCAYGKNGRLIDVKVCLAYECNSKCACGSHCPSRVVQTGITPPLELFRSGRKGLGVRAVLDTAAVSSGSKGVGSSKKADNRIAIPKGTFIAEYLGEVITMSMVHDREKEYDKLNLRYIFDMDHGQETQFALDATYIGNASRFFNHSCSPNMVVISIYCDTQDPRIHRVAFFAKRDIRAGEELTFDYTQNQDVKGLKGVVPCACSSKTCKGFLFFVANNSPCIE